MSLNKVLDTAVVELGNTECPPGSNNVKYNTAYYGYEVAGDAWKWCLVFLWWVFQQAGERMAFFGGGKTASCGTLLRWYQGQGLTVPVSQVQPGDIVILNFHGTKDTEHCGLVVDVDGIYITTIEGNTSEAGSQSNGGIVCRKTRYPSQIVGVCRPNYTEEMVPVDDIKGHWAEDAIRWCIDHGIMQGYEDGSFRPDASVTRAELAVVVKRIMEACHD